MAALVHKEATSRGIGFLRLYSINLLRTLSAAATSPEPSTAEKKPKRRKKKNLFEVAQFLPNWGIGYQMAKNHWEGISYQITKINLYKDGRHGKAWGIFHKAGLPAADAPKKISGVHKRGWRYIPESVKKKNLQTTPTKPKEQNLAA